LGGVKKSLFFYVALGLQKIDKNRAMGRPRAAKVTSTVRRVGRSSGEGSVGRLTRGHGL